MEGYRALYTQNHVIEPLGYGIVKKTVRRGARVHSGLEQYRIQSIASLYESKWFSVPKPLTLELSSKSYAMPEVIDGHVMSRSEVMAYMDLSGDLELAWTQYILYMIKEGYFVRGSRILRCNEGTPFQILDVSLYGTIQGDLVKFPDERWAYSILQAELLHGIR